MGRPSQFTDSSNSRLLQELLTGNSIHANITDWGYLDLALVVHLLLTYPILTAIAKSK